MAVVLESMQSDLETLARSPPGMCAGASLQIPSCRHESATQQRARERGGADLEAGRAPIDELDRALRLDGGDGRIDVLGDDVSTALLISSTHFDA